MKKYFKREYLLDELGLPWGDDEHVIEDTIDYVDCGIVYHTMIFRDDDGKTYRVNYDKPDEPENWIPWDGEDDIECQEVVPIETIKWVVKKEQE